MRLRESDQKAVDAFLGAESWPELIAVLRNHQQLLLREETATLIEMLAGDLSPAGRQICEQRIELLVACRNLGVDVGISVASGGDDLTPDDLFDQLEEMIFRGGEYIYTGQVESLKRCETLFQELIADNRVAGQPQPWRRRLWSGGAGAAMSFYDRDGRLESVNSAVLREEAAARLTHPGSPTFPLVLAGWSNALLTRHLHTGEREDLDAAVRLATDAVIVSRDGRPTPLDGQAMALNNLGGAIIQRYFLDGATVDLDTAVFSREQAGDLVEAEDWYEYGRYRSGLAQALEQRAVDQDRLSDLDRALEIVDDVLTVVPSESPEHVIHLSVQASLLKTRALVFQDVSSLVATLKVLRELIMRTPPGTREMQMVAADYVSVCIVLFPLAPEEIDLDGLVVLVKRLAMETAESRLATTMKYMYATALNVRSLPEGSERSAVEESKTAWTELLAAPALTTGQRASGTLALAMAHLRSEDWDPDAGERARQGFRDAFELIRKAGRGFTTMIPATVDWARVAIARSCWPDAVAAYRMGTASSDDALRVEPFREYQRVWLSRGQTLSSLGAYAYARLDDGTAAAAAAESGHARMLTAALFSEPAGVREAALTGRPDLAERYRAAAAEYRRLTADAGQAMLDDVGLSERFHEQRGRSASRASDALHQVLRELEEARPAAPEWQPRARPGETLVYIVMCSAGAASLIVRSTGRVEVLWHDKLTPESLADVRRVYLDGYTYRRVDPLGWTGALEFATSWLGDVLMADVVEAVGPGTSMTLVPSGALSLMPLHAALVGGPSTRVTNMMRTTYAPSGRIATSGRPPLSSQADTLLVVDALDGRALSTLNPNGFAGLKHLHGSSATTGEVLGGLTAFSVVHFAAHGVLNMHDVRQSRLKLNVGTELTLAALSVADRTPLSLVVLAACESGLHAADVPDEVIGLASAFLELGASGVIASQWAVPRVATATLMRTFYGIWRASEGIHPADALREAQASLRNGEVRAGLDSWAGFVYLGA